MEPRTKAFGGNYGSRAHLVLLDPQLIKEFLTKHELYIKDPSLLLLLREICGDGLVVSHGESWKRKRRLTSSVFHFDFLREIIPEIVSTANQLLDEWDLK
jgi:PHYB activation tagged suppressor 1